ncbi:MAG: DUF4373 domain-containing protein [Desulfobacterales bacterium]|nr:DUF4373 domain-containing protein [Desulfobacterales bacterium]
MARPNKAGLEYFPLDVDVDDKIELLEAKHGIVGFGVLIKLYQQIYKAGYFINLTEDRLLLLRKKIDVDIDKINEVINDCLRWELFDRDLFKLFGILTSTGIQKRYAEATKRRKDVEWIEEYILLKNLKALYPAKVNVTLCSHDVCNNPEAEGVNVDINSNDQNKGGEGRKNETPDNADINPQAKGVNVNNNSQADGVNADINTEAGGVNDDKNVNANINSQAKGVNVNINPQSKVKESKVKKIIPRPDTRQDSTSDPPPKDDSPSGFSFENNASKKATPVIDKTGTNGYEHFFQGINKACDDISGLPAKKKKFSPQKWAQVSINAMAHPGAIMETLQGLSLFWKTTDDPWGMCNSILRTKNGNWNEKEAIAIHQELKSMPSGQLDFFTNGLIREIT